MGNVVGTINVMGSGKVARSLERCDWPRSVRGGAHNGKGNVGFVERTSDLCQTVSGYVR